MVRSSPYYIMGIQGTEGRSPGRAVVSARNDIRVQHRSGSMNGEKERDSGDTSQIYRAW